MRKPKLRELKEALRSLLSPAYTTTFPATPHEPPDGFRGRPEYHEDGCIGCRTCAEVCPAIAIKVQDDLAGEQPRRTLTCHWDKCVYCGQCELCCPTKEGIKLSKKFDHITLDRATLRTSVELDLVVCQVCGCAVGTRKHLVWVAERLGAKAYANPTLIVAADGAISLAEPVATAPESLARNNMMRVACPDCRRTIVLREMWGE